MLDSTARSGPNWKAANKALFTRVAIIGKGIDDVKRRFVPLRLMADDAQ